MGGVGEHLEHGLVSPSAAAVFGRSRATTGQTARIDHAGLRVGQALDEHVVAPVVAEVVDVLEASLTVRQGLGERHRLLVLQRKGL